jgi:hypothetical protein
MNSSRRPDPPPPDWLDDLDASEMATLADLTAVLSCAVPQVAPAPLNLSLIHVRAGLRNLSPVSRRTRALAITGWAAAACLGASALFLQRKSAHYQNEITTLRATTSASRPMATAVPRSPSAVTPANPAQPSVASEGEENAAGSVPPGSFFQSSAGQKTYVLVQDLEKLKADLAHLRQANAARFEGQPGLARMVVVEMGDPQRPAPSTDKISVLTERAADALASGLGQPASTTTTPPVDPSLRLSGDGAAWSNDIVIDNGMIPLSRLNLDADQIVRHRNFPINDAARYGLEALDQGFFYDSHNQFVWRPSTDGKSYLGWRDEGFNPDDYRSGTTGFPAPPPTLNPNTLPSSEVPTTPDAAAGLSPRAFTLFDETTGGGSIILQNLPSARDGSVYQLWLTDPASPEPISVGLLPPLESGSERVYFEFGKPGVAPGGYLLTREPAGGSRRPGNDVILKGP